MAKPPSSVRNCTVDTCGGKHKGHGLCDRHLQRIRRTGSLADPVKPLAERFWEKVERRGPDECWPWKAATNEHGYGVIRPPGQRSGPGLRAHRVSADLAGMHIDGLDVLHSCDNPPCCNPAHLRPGTKADNAADRSERDRVSHGDQHPYAKLTSAQAAEIYHRRCAGEPCNALAAEFGVSSATITRIAQGKGWRRAVTPPAARDLIAAVVESITGEAVA